MSTSKSSYPERPAGGKRPLAPGKGRNKPSSEHISGRRRVWKEEPTVEKGLKLAEAHIAPSLCRASHTNPALERFFKLFRYNKVPVRFWGGRVKMEV